MNKSESYVEVKVGENFSINTFSRGSMGYIHKVEICEENVIFLNKDKTPCNDELNILLENGSNNATNILDRNHHIKIGGMTEIELNFKALEVGENVVRIIHFRPWSEEEDKIVETVKIKIVE